MQIPQHVEDDEVDYEDEDDDAASEEFDDEDEEELGANVIAGNLLAQACQCGFLCRVAVCFLGLCMCTGSE